MSNVPSLQEELNRKTLETLEKINADYTLGKISKAQYKYGVDIAWSCVAGLVEQDLIRMFEWLDKDTKSISYSEKTVYRHLKSGIDIVIIDSKTGLLLYKRLHQGSPDKVQAFDLRAEPNPYLAAKEKLQQLDSDLINKGFVRL